MPSQMLHSVDEVPAPTQMNWLIHTAYVNKDFETAEVKIPPL